MKAVLISIQPKWCAKIANGEKTIEVRKNRPKSETPFKCYIYCTQSKTIGDIILCKSKENAKLFGFNAVKGINKGFAEKEDINLKGKVIGEFVCDRIYTAVPDYNPPMAKFFNYDFYNDRGERLQDCLTSGELSRYGDGAPLYGWHITDLKIYDEPKDLSKFERPCNFKWECSLCERYDRREHKCYKAIIRPPQSWCYVEELK